MPADGRHQAECQETQVLTQALSTTSYPLCAFAQITSSPFLAAVD